MESKNSFWQSRKGHAFDIVVVTAVYFYVILVVAPFEENLILQISAYILGGFFILYVFFISQYLHKDTAAERGFGSWKTLFIRTDNLKKSAKEVLLIITPLLILGIFVTALILGTLWNPEGEGFSAWLVDQGLLEEENLLIDFFGQFLYYILWGFIQQVLFLSFIHVRLRKVFPTMSRMRISLLTGAIFGSYHLFNFPLVTFTFVSGTIWAWSFYETPNLLTVSISHGLGGTLSSIFVFQKSIGWHMTVGWPGLGWGP